MTISLVPGAEIGFTLLMVLGGGGGIAMMAGVSRMFAPLPFLLTILIAVIPIPLMFYIGRLEE